MEVIIQKERIIRKLIFIIQIFSFFILFCSCNGRKNMNCKIDFYQIVNNELRSSELITKKVELNSSADFYAKTS